MKNMFLKVRLSAEEKAGLDDMRGRSTQSDFVRDLLNKNAIGERREVGQFVDLLKNIEDVTKVAAALERIEQKLTEPRSDDDGDKAVKMIETLVAHLNKLIAAGRGITAIKEVPTPTQTKAQTTLSPKALERIDETWRHMGWNREALARVLAIFEGIAQALKVKLPALSDEEELQPLEGATVEERQEQIFSEVQQFERRIAGIESWSGPLLRRIEGGK